MAGEFRVGAQLLGMAEVLDTFRNLAEGGKRMRTVFKRIGDRVLIPSFKETLGSGGRGAWPAERRAVKKHRMLGSDGKIARGLKTVANDRYVDVGTTSGFGVWAQQGFTASIRAEQPKRKKAMRLFTPGGVVFAERVRAHTTTVPARKFLFLTAGDEEAIVTEVATYMDRLARREAKAGGG